MSKILKVGIAALVMVVLVVIAIPNFLPPRLTASQNVCFSNLQVIQVAKKRWAEIYEKSATDTPTELDLFSESNAVAFSRGTKYSPAAFTRMPACPAGGVLTIGTMSEEPTCSSGFDGHSVHPKQKQKE